MPTPFDRNAVLAALSAHNGALTTEEARVFGLSSDRLATAERHGVLRALRRGVYVDESTWAAGTDAARVVLAARAATRLFRDGVVAFDTGAWLHGLPTPRMVTHGGVPVIHLARRGVAERSGWIRLHRATDEPEFVIHTSGLPVTTIVRSAVDVARSTDAGRAVAVLDAALRVLIAQTVGDVDVRRGVLRDDLVGRAREQLSVEIERLAGYTGIARARHALALASPASESVLESLSRHRMHVRRFPTPEIGQPVLGADGKTYWADFLWRDQRVIGEADGMLKYDDDPLALRREKVRHEMLTRAGYRVVRWMWSDLRDDAFLSLIGNPASRAA